MMGRHAESALRDMLGRVEGLNDAQAESLMTAYAREVINRLEVNVSERHAELCPEDAPKVYRLAWHHALHSLWDFSDSLSS